MIAASFVSMLVLALTITMIANPVDANAANDLVSGDSSNVPNSVFEIYTGQGDGKQDGLKYYLYSPVKGSDDTTEYPVLIWLHGLGADGSADYAALEGSDIKNFVKEEYQSYFPEGGFYLVVPQNPEKGGAWTSFGWMGADFTGVLNNVIDEVIANNQINTDKIYIAGYSAGGHMTWKAVH